MKVKPCIVVETSPNRYHLYFRAKCPPSLYEQRARALVAALKGDPQAVDRCRAFRLAGTINWKPKRNSFVAKLRFAKNKLKPLTAKSIVLKLGGDIDDTRPTTSTSSAASPRAHDSVSVEQIRAQLSKIPAIDRDVWLHVGMALHSWNPVEGFALWDNWAKNVPEKYESSRQQPTWDGFDSLKGIGVRSLFYYANKYGGGETPDKGESWLPTHDSDIVAYAAEVLTGQLKISGDQHFYVFEEHGWRRDKKVAARLLMGVVERLHKLAKESGSEFARKALKPKCGFNQAQRMLTEFHGIKELDVHENQFDANEEMLGVQNGVVNLRTGKFRAGRPGDMVSIKTAATYVPNAKCPKFQKFIKEIAPSDGYRQYLQLLLGYLLVGKCPEQHAYIMIGSGSNGKGTLTRIVRAVMGDTYCAVLSPGFVKNASKGNANGPTPAIMTLRDARAIFCTESEQKRGIDELFFKQLTGNDALTGRQLYGEQETFQAKGKLLLSTNAMPDWSYEDEALWRRVVVLPFTKQFKGKGRNNDLDAELAAESSGVLNWMIAGALRYLKKGLGECREVTEATQYARHCADTVQMWIEEECEVNENRFVQAKNAYEAYTAFAGRKRLSALSNKQFSIRMRVLGYVHHRKNACYVYKGLYRIGE